ncbi:MAG TPA: glycosyltransferase [Elusimicrobiota bacterium]|jgi:glycosyltransferase involved in cell wall biosynthesis|nr:glycosyltransferase [Elusimicrobiota bacterium]
MRLLLVPDPTSPNGEDAFCRELAKRAPARGHSCAIRAASAGPAAADAAVVNGLQEDALLAAEAAGVPVVLRLIDSYLGAREPGLAAAKRFAAAAGRVLVPSAYMKGVVAGWGVDAGRVRVVPYAYDQIFAQQIALVTMRAARPSGFGLVTAGPVDDSTLPAFEAVLSAVSRLRLDCHLAVLGEGPALGALKARAESLMLGPRVTFLGDLPHPKKMEYLRAAKAFIEPSGRQGFPSLALHAMSEGCPVVGAAAGAVPELVRDGENGLLFRPGDAGALSEQIVTLASTPGLSLKLIAEGVRTVERHSWDATAAAAFDAIESLEARA